MLYAARYFGTFPNRREEASCQHELAQKLLNWAMKQEYGVEPASFNLAYGPQGKPFFADHPARFSLSHCRGLVCCALSGEEIGVDAERILPYDPRLARRICTPEEMEYLSSAPDRDEALTVLWTLKESLMKLTGEGMRYGFQNASFAFRQGNPVPALQGVQAACFRSVPGFLVSVCCRGDLPKELKLVDLPRLS